jgi:large exoprotein involved in heme utilization and adhesion
MEDSEITSTNYSDARKGGKLLLAVEESASFQHAGFYTESKGKGDGGDIEIQAGSLSLTHTGQLATVTYGAGNSGNVDIRAKKIVIDAVMQPF